MSAENKGGSRWLRTNVFVDKFRRRKHRMKSKTAASTFLSSADVGEILSATEFASVHQLHLDVSLCIAWTAMGIKKPSDVKRTWTRFRRCLADYFRQRRWPQAWVACFEGTGGLHVHMALHVPFGRRREFRQWVESWMRRETLPGNNALAAFAMTRHARENPLIGLRLASYMIKGVSRTTVADDPARVSDQLILLADILPYAAEPTGRVPFKRIYVGAALNARQRQWGSPYGAPLDTSWACINPVSDDTWAPSPWVSAWERGERDVNFLFPKEFVDAVRTRHGKITPFHERDMQYLRDGNLRLANWSVRAEAASGQTASEANAWVTVAVRNIEIVLRVLTATLDAFTLMAAMRDPHDRTAAKDNLKSNALSCRSAIREAGEEFSAHDGLRAVPTSTECLRLLSDVDHHLRLLLSELGVETTGPEWARQLSLAALAT